jgi:Ras GTPase-activating protein 1
MSHLVDPKMRTARCLTLVAKTLQNLANMVDFGLKEAYMKDMNVFITENRNNMKQFLDKISVKFFFVDEN